MAFSIKDLLGDAVARARIGREVQTARLIAKANEYLPTLLPPGHADDALAVACQRGQLIIACHSSAAAHYITQRKAAILEYLLREVPQADLHDLQTRLP